MNYIIQTKGYTTDLKIQNSAEENLKPFKSLGATLEAILDMLEYNGADIAEVLICNELGNAMYQVRPTGPRQFHLAELY